jgi:F0F1-type ATP synthase assembly protein I
MRRREKKEAPPLNTAKTAKTAAGRQLDPATKAFMEPRFQHDFSGVRVHTDSDASESARALNARAYTVGDDIVFAPGQYAPETQAGRKLLAHELAHVVQQGGAPSALQPLSLSPVNSAPEREASAAAETVARGGRVEGGIRSRAGGLLQRDEAADAPDKKAEPYKKTGTGKTVAADIGGTLVGGAIGAGLGFLIGGPIGAIIGGILGAIAGLILADTGVTNDVPLTPEEEAEARPVFGDSLNYKDVRKGESALMTVGPGSPARTPFNTIYFPPGAIKQASDLSYMAWLIHEMTHCWQTQHGISVVTKLFWALHGKKTYDYGKEEGLRKAATAGKHFTEFNTEQQADIARNYYIALKQKSDLTPYAPFIAELQAGGKKLETGAKPGGSPAPGPSPAPPAPADAGAGGGK